MRSVMYVNRVPHLTRRLQATLFPTNAYNLDCGAWLTSKLAPLIVKVGIILFQREISAINFGSFFKFHGQNFLTSISRIARVQ